MSQAIRQYINRVVIYANPTEAEEPQIRNELEDHLCTKVEELVEQGESREDAIFQAIEAQGRPDKVGYGLRKFRWVDVRHRGTARGFIAIGPKAVGVFAFGGATLGVFSFGGFSAGLFAFGGFSLALLFGWGGFVVSLLGVAYGGVALGLLALGGFAAGVYAMGGTVIGIYANGPGSSTCTLLPFSDAPNWIQSILNFSESDHWFGIFNIIIVSGWIILFYFMWIMQRRERRRIHNADPQLVE